MIRRLTFLAVMSLAALGCDESETTVEPLRPDGGGAPPAEPDAAPVETEQGPAGAACDQDGDCLGGTCVGDANGPETGNPRFTGGYCTALGCIAESQNGCGPDEWCVDMGFDTMCLEQCSRAAGMECEREDHFCAGVGTWGGCLHRDSIECYTDMPGTCPDGEICVKIGFDSGSKEGRCETLCDPMNDTTCASNQACYYIRRYNNAFCGTPGTAQPEQLCSCDKCCIPGWACTPDLDGLGRHCKEYCSVAAGCSDPAQQCVPIESGSPWGGCVAPGSAGT
jgi:hypothetical protein